MPEGTQGHRWLLRTFAYGGLTLCATPSQVLPLIFHNAVVRALQPRSRNLERFGLFRVRSPLLAESLLISFPAGT